MQNFIYSFNSNGGQTTIGDFYKKMAYVSIRTAQQHAHALCTLYADKEAIKQFSHVPFDNVICVDFAQFGANPYFWNFGKLYTYSLQEKPFLHVDFDVIFHRGITIPTAPIVTERIRNIYEHAPEFSEMQILRNLQPQQIICSGIIGGTRTDIFKELFEHAKIVCSQRPTNATGENINYLIAVEEYNLTQLIARNRVQVREIEPHNFTHFQGDSKKERFAPLVEELYKIYTNE